MIFKIKLERSMLRASFKNKFVKDVDIKLWNKRSRISLLWGIGRRIQVYNGAKFQNVTITRHMVGHTLGEFCITKHLGADIHVKSKKAVAQAKKK